MNEQERQVISGIFERLRQVESHPRDPEAERYIAERVAAQPYAPYALAQAVYAQEQALLKLNAELEETRAALERAQAQPAQSSSFLGSLFGGGSRAEAEPAPRSAIGMPGAGMAPRGPWSAAQGAPRSAGGGGFLQTAAMTAAGVAGGMVLGNLLMNAFGGKQGEAVAGQDAAAQPASYDQPADDARYQEAGYDDPNANDDGMDFDGGDGWA